MAINEVTRTKNVYGFLWGRVKREAPRYRYEDHSGDAIKRMAVKVVATIRKITVKIPSRVFYILSWMVSPVVFITFSVPSKIVKTFKGAHHFADRMPFNFETNPFSLRGDLYDRFNVPIEYRFSKQDVFNIFNESGFKEINITRLKDRAGWVAWGYKK